MLHGRRASNWESETFSLSRIGSYLIRSLRCLLFNNSLRIFPTSHKHFLPNNSNILLWRKQQPPARNSSSCTPRIKKTFKFFLRSRNQKQPWVPANFSHSEWKFSSIWNEIFFMNTFYDFSMKINFPPLFLTGSRVPTGTRNCANNRAESDRMRSWKPSRAYTREKCTCIEILTAKIWRSEIDFKQSFMQE